MRRTVRAYNPFEMKLSNENTTPTRKPAELLREVFLTRKERNPAYSQAAFARDLGTSVALLSRVMSDQRPMSLKFGLQVTTALGLSEQESNALLYSILKNSSKKAKISARVRHRLENDFNSQSDSNGPVYTTVEIERFKAMSQWYHLAILNLTTVEGFDPSPRWIARALGISNAEAAGASERLVALGLLNETEGTLNRTKEHFYIKTQKSEGAMRKFHSQMIEKASNELTNADDEQFKRRLINSITFSCGPEHIEAIKDRINRCQDEILALVGTGKKTSVYQMNAQFFPLSQSKPSGEKP